VDDEQAEGASRWFDLAPDWAEENWVLFLPGLSEDRAKRILQLIRDAGLAYGAEILSPDVSAEFLLDRVTALWLRAALSSNSSVVVDLGGRSMVEITPAEARQGLEALVSYLDEFIDRSDKLPVETDVAVRFDI